MSQHYVHVITLNIPYPANYGGVIDMYHRLRALKNIGINVILHSFEYNRPQTDELLKVCSKVYYYPRITGLRSCLSTIPYNVYSRRSEQLLEDLLKDEYPIFFEGLHTTFLINHPKLRNRKKILRPCNVEHEYYAELGKAEYSLHKKIFFFIESMRLKRYEPKAIEHTDLIIAVSKHDQKHFIDNYPDKKSLFIPCFHEFDHVDIKTGDISDYILYHGNLSVSENDYAAIWLINNVFSKTRYKCIIAGMDPSKRLKKLTKLHDNISLIPNPSQDEMRELIANAQLNILVTFQGSGLKLKLLHALFSGRHLIVNSTMMVGTELSNACTIADSPSEIIKNCEELMKIPFTGEDKEKREAHLLPQYSNTEQAKILASAIF
ncbi:MAG: glycosyltransferase family 1 protein [Bacteroidales bacterium]|nr:glycosyltransferase family 1 protein [Bacteroidales bacterium]